ncbi:MAG: MarR family transcriptional regulator [Nanoarchaeota archaeon]
MSQRITIVRVRRKSSDNINEELQWLGNSLGLFTARDKDRSCFRVFITLIRKAKRNEPLTSDEIAERSDLSRGTVVHHLHRLMEAGLVVREKEGYLLRENSLHNIVRDIHRDLENFFEELEQAAQQIDERLGN